MKYEWGNAIRRRAFEANSINEEFSNITQKAMCSCDISVAIMV